MRYLLFCCALLAVGCGKKDWVHPDKPKEAMYKELSDCQKETRNISGPRARREMLEYCMESKGWR
jgi:hypothetical protein